MLKNHTAQQNALYRERTLTSFTLRLFLRSQKERVQDAELARLFALQHPLVSSIGTLA